MTDVKRRNGKISGKTGNSGRKHKVTFHSFIYFLQGGRKDEKEGGMRRVKI